MRDIYELYRLSSSELDNFLVELILDIEFERNRPALFRDLTPMNIASSLVLPISREGHAFRRKLADTSWQIEGWISSTDTRLNVDKFVPPYASIDSNSRPYSKPLGGLWTSPLRSDGTTPWGRYSYAHSNQRSVNPALAIPTNYYERENALHLNTLADVEVESETFGAVIPLSTEWFRAVQVEYHSIRFSWIFVLEAYLENSTRYEGFAFLSVCSTFWLQLPIL